MTTWFTSPARRREHQSYLGRKEKKKQKKQQGQPSVSVSDSELICMSVSCRETLPVVTVQLPVGPTSTIHMFRNFLTRAVNCALCSTARPAPLNVTSCNQHTHARTRQSDRVRIRSRTEIQSSLAFFNHEIC